MDIVNALLKLKHNKGIIWREGDDRVMISWNGVEPWSEFSKQLYNRPISDLTAMDWQWAR